MPALPAPRPLPLSAYQRLGSPIPFATASDHNTIQNRNLYGHSIQHIHGIRGGGRGEVSVHGRREIQEYARPTEFRDSTNRARGGTYTAANRAGEAQYPDDRVDEVYSPDSVPMEMAEQLEGSGEGTMFLPHYEGYSYMLVPSHLEDDVAGLIFNAESLPVYEGPIHQPSTLNSASNMPDTQQPLEAPPYQSSINNTPGRGLHLQAERSNPNQQNEVPPYPSPISRTSGSRPHLLIEPLNANQQTEAPPYRSPVTGTSGRGLQLRLQPIVSHQHIEAPLYQSPVNIAPGNSSQHSEAPPYHSPIVRTAETDDLPAYRPASPEVSRSSSVRSQPDELPAYRAPTPRPTPAAASSTINVSASIPPLAPLFATPARPVATVLATPRTMPTENRPVGSILRVRDPIPGTTYPFDPTAERTPTERAAHEAFALALFTQHNSRQPAPHVAHDAPLDQLLTEEEVLDFDVEAYNARQEWRERQAEERRERYQERQRLRQSQSAGEVDVAAEEMYQLQEAIQMSLEEAENEGNWGPAADEEEEVDEELAQALDLSLRIARIAQAGRDNHYQNPPVYHLAQNTAETRHDQPRSLNYGHPRPAAEGPAQVRSTQFEDVHIVQTLQIPQGLTQYASPRDTQISPTLRDGRSGSTDTNKPLPGLPPT